jgi:hypothetical protein
MDRPWSRVPSWVGAALRPELAGTIDGIIAAVRAEVPEYARPLTGRFGARITEGVSVALGQFLDLLGRDDPLGDSTVYRALGQLEHREGRTLAALQTAYQVGTRTLWQRLAASRTARQLPPEVIFNLAEALFGYIEQISACRRAAAAAGWTVPARVAALVVDDAVAVAARLPGAVGADLDPVGMVVVSARGDADGGWLDRVRGATGERRAVLGPVVEPAQAHRSAALAQAAWPLHAAGRLDGDAPLVRADEHLLPLLLATAPDLAAALAERALAPLRALPPGAGARSEETLRAWLDAHGDVTATAAALHLHPQTVRYRLASLRETFGGVLDDPTARLELAVALRAGSTCENSTS